MTMIKILKRMRLFEFKEFGLIDKVNSGMYDPSLTTELQTRLPYYMIRGAAGGGAVNVIVWRCYFAVL